MLTLHTGIIYILSSIVFVFGAYKFYKVWREQKNYVSKIFSILFLFLSLAIFIDGLVWEIIFFFNPKLLYLTMVDGFITFCFPLGIIGYLATYLKFPNILPKYGFFATFFLSIIFGALNLFYSVSMSPESGNFANWQFYPILGTLSSLVFIIPSIFIVISFFQQTKISSDRITKIKSIGFGSAFFLAVIAAGFNLIFSDFDRLNSIVSDVGLASVSFIVLFIFIFVPNIAQVPHNKNN